MRIIKSVEEMQSLADSMRSEGITIGFVPTMGALHEGHLSLVTESNKQTDKTVLSIFVNPAQFSPSEDFSSYPKDFKKDEERAAENDVDLVFYPSADEIYPEGFSTYTTVGKIGETLEGESRPSHFKGVTTVVNKFFNTVKPHYAFFGQKDAQQAVIIRRMVNDLNIDVKIVVCPTVREEDGLALSSRNSYLSSNARNEAPLIYQSLKEAETLHSKKNFDAELLSSKIIERIESSPIAKLDYVAVVHPETLQPLKSTEEGALICVAVFIENTRLIDNIILSS